MAQIPQAWAQLPFFTESYPQITATLAREADVLPPASLRFAALDAVAPAKVRVVILGQDPYPTAGHGNGLAFSVNPDVQPCPDPYAIFSMSCAMILVCREPPVICHTGPRRAYCC